LFGVLGFHEGFERCEIRLPERTVMAQPGVHSFERGGIQLVDAMAAFAVFVDEACAAEEAKVLGDSWAGDREGSGNGSGGKIAAAEKVEDGAASRIGESAESGFRICNRTVTHNV
jgi:hypothetical protein